MHVFYIFFFDHHTLYLHCLIIYSISTKRFNKSLLCTKKTPKQTQRKQKPVTWSLLISVSAMSDKSELKAELERKKQRLAQIREEKKRKEEERKKKEVRNNFHFENWLAYVTGPDFKKRFT